MASHLAYFNGKWVPDKGLGIPVNDPGFLLGATVTERLRTFRGRVWRQEAHYQRLSRSLELIGLAPKISEELDSAITEFGRRHEPLRMSGDDWVIVAFATPGEGNEATRCVHGFPLPFTQWAHEYAHGVRLRVTDVQQTPGDCWPPELKCRSRMHYYLADQQAAAAESGARALLLDREGFVCETSTANVVIYRKGEGIFTPPAEKTLPGVSLAVLRGLAEERGVPFAEHALTPEDITSADEVWLTGTSGCLLPVASCDGKPIGTGEPGPVYRRFLAAWNDLVGLDIAAQAVERAAEHALAAH